MILSLMPDQVSTFWDELKPAIEKSLSPGDRTPEVVNYLLHLLLGGSMQCWVSFDGKSVQREINGVSLTRIEKDSFTGKTNLLIYTMTRIKEDMSDELKDTTYIEAFDGLRKFAVVNECDNIIGFTPLDYIADLARKFEADVTYKMVWRIK